eukprot:4584003-Pyramimonas_sp.AAC.1
MPQASSSSAAPLSLAQTLNKQYSLVVIRNGYVEMSSMMAQANRQREEEDISQNRSNLFLEKSNVNTVEDDPCLALHAVEGRPRHGLTLDPGAAE